MPSTASGTPTSATTPSRGEVDSSAIPITTNMIAEPKVRPSTSNTLPM
jgi:hypothetical protein